MDFRQRKSFRTTAKQQRHLRKTGPRKTRSVAHYAQWHLIESLIAKPVAARSLQSSLLGCSNNKQALEYSFVWIYYPVEGVLEQVFVCLQNGAFIVLATDGTGDLIVQTHPPSNDMSPAVPSTSVITPTQPILPGSPRLH